VPYHAVVLITGFTAFARRRRLALLVVLLLAVMLGVLGNSGDWDIWFQAFAVVLVVLSVVSAARYHPAVLVARPKEPAFAAPPDPGRVFLAAALLLQGGQVLADNLHDIRQGDALTGLSAALVGLWVLGLALLWRTTWGWFGVQLRPEGVYDRQPLGSLFTPWDALVRAYPAAASGAHRVALHYQRRELVRQRGLRSGGATIATVSIDAAFLARAIQEYVSHPEYRSAIGTGAELRRLTAAIAG
jgi:hypothetical protein